MDTNKADLTSVETHFSFGKNWAEFSKKIGDLEIDEAVRGLSRLIKEEEISGKHFLDIGCGSGLHALSAIRLGAKRVVAVDIDKDSVSTTREVLEHHASPSEGFEKMWQVDEKSVFDLSPDKDGQFDIVYSWGVLHHTGDLSRALKNAAACVVPNGLFCFALYRRTWMDWFWCLEKRWYAQSASPKAQERARRIYIAFHRVCHLLLCGRKAHAHYVANYQRNRGMDFYHDVHDWMGGWPYEPISQPEVAQCMESLGFELVREFVFSGRPHGLLGSGCDEYVYRRKA